MNTKSSLVRSAVGSTAPVAMNPGCFGRTQGSVEKLSPLQEEVVWSSTEHQILHPYAGTRGSSFRFRIGVLAWQAPDDQTKIKLCLPYAPSSRIPFLTPTATTCATTVPLEKTRLRPKYGERANKLYTATEKTWPSAQSKGRSPPL